jgi:hypothetical protein
MESDLSKITKDVSPSAIPLEKPVVVAQGKPEIYKSNSIVWQQKSEELLSDYKYGWNLGRYSDNKALNTSQFIKRFSSAIISMVSNECSKEGRSSEIFSSHFAILHSIMTLIARDLEALNLKKHKPQSLLAVMHGFIDSYIDMKIKEE